MLTIILGPLHLKYAALPFGLHPVHIHIVLVPNGDPILDWETDDFNNVNLVSDDG